MIEKIMECSQRAVREGYRLLLRIRVELCLPVEHPQICEFYRLMGESCGAWAEEIVGDSLRRTYLALESNAERGRMRTATYRLQGRVIWESNTHAVFLYESCLVREGEEDRWRTSQIWDLREQTLLPLRQAVRLLTVGGDLPRLPFRADGVYPEGDALVFFSNPRERQPGRELRVPVSRRPEEPKRQEPL